MTRRRALEWTGVALLYGTSLAVARWCGLHYVVTENLWHLIDSQLLEAHPLGGLVYLHSQPPGLNALFALLLSLQARAGVSVAASGEVLFGVIGLGVALLLYEQARRMAGRVAAVVAVVLLLVMPGFHVYRAGFFYSLLLAAAMLAVVFFARRYFDAGRAADCVAVGASALALGWTSSLFPPTACAALLLAVIALRTRWAPRRELRPVAGWLVLFLALLAAWPAKNAWVFGSPFNTSWTGFNLTRLTPVDSPEVNRFIATGAVPEWAAKRWEETKPEAAWAARALSEPRKPTSAFRNLNHYLFVYTRAEQVRAGLAWRLGSPGRWARMAATYYRYWSMPTDFNPYTGASWRKDVARFDRWASAYERLLFFDVGVPAAAPETEDRGSTFLRRLQDATRPVPLTIFAVAGFPLLLALSGWALWRRRPWDPESGAAALALGAVVWTLLVPCLTDGLEGNRMRFTSAPLIPLLWTYVLATWRRSRASRASAS
jgi:hypothetical protein